MRKEVLTVDRCGNVRNLPIFVLGITGKQVATFSHVDLAQGISSRRALRERLSRAGAAMCYQCQELETIIERYRRIMARIDGDPQVAVGIAGLTKEAEAEKIALHRREQQK